MFLNAISSMHRLATAAGRHIPHHMANRVGVCGLMLVTLVALATPGLAGTTTGTWSQLNNYNPEYLSGTMLLLTDGTVMVQSNYDNQTWTRLTPDATGSYVNGTWTTLAKMSIPRLYFASHVLPDGRVWVLGGEYSGYNLNQNWTNTGEIYDPVTNKWKAIAKHPDPLFGDVPTTLLRYGYILAGSLETENTYLYYPPGDFWFSNILTKLRSDRSDEETWITLPDGSVLSYDIFASDTSGTGSAQRFSLNSFAWVDSGTVPVLLSGPVQGYELGPGSVLPNGNVIVIGANENSAIYTPPVSSNLPGSWVAGPTLPAGMGADDAPGAMLPDGHFIFLADFYQFTSPTSMFDYDYNTGTLTDITSTLPPQLQDELFYGSAYVCRMLVIPDGGILLTTNNFFSLWHYLPSGTPQDSWRPTIASATKVSSHQYTITGTRVTGISEGASYGDDAEMSTNYPIVRLVNNGVVTYGKTTNWTPGISAVGSNSSGTFTLDLPTTLAPGTYQATVIANGIPSATSVNITYTQPGVVATYNPTNLTMTITGDAEANAINVVYAQVKKSRVVIGGTVTITSTDGFTTINGQPGPVVINVGPKRMNLTANMGDGDDSITINTLFGATVNLNLGNGNDSAKILYSSIYTLLKVDGGTGTDTLTLTGDAIIKKTITSVP
ncbi:MAG: hypothetical protein JSS49_04155 [Planctomycetes bacterium]|nr:hypothetical protein [Planctomycetota bacterium]